MRHEQLPGVPRICEICFGPVITEHGHYSVFFNWPGSFGLPVFAHADTCHQHAVDRIKRSGPRSIRD